MGLRPVHPQTSEHRCVQPRPGSGSEELAASNLLCPMCIPGTARPMGHIARGFGIALRARLERGDRVVSDAGGVWNQCENKARGRPESALAHPSGCAHLVGLTPLMSEQQ